MPQIHISDEAGMETLGRRIGALIGKGNFLYLHGELGAGKTTLARGILHGLGISGRVKSPTYTLVEPYESPTLSAYHFDLYRLADPQELEFLGLRDYFTPRAVVLVEWPERGAGVLPAADAHIYIAYAGEGRDIRLEPGAGGRCQWLENFPPQNKG